MCYIQCCTGKYVKHVQGGNIMDFVPLIGRILFSVIFIMNGLNHFTSLGDMTAYAEAMGVPLPTLAVIITGIMMLLGGLSILLGYKAKIGAILLIVFLIPTAFIMHSFWAFDDPQRAQVEMAQFLKNIAMAGGALFFLYFGSGPKSIEKKEE